MNDIFKYSFIGFVYSSVYTYSYWDHIGINPFPYITIDQFLLQSITGLIYGSLSLLLFSIAGAAFPSKHGIDYTADKVKFNLNTGILFYTLSILSFVLGCINGSLGFIVFGLSLFFGNPASINLANTPIFEKISNNVSTRRLILYLLFVTPGLALIMGEVEAKQKSSIHYTSVSWIDTKNVPESVGKKYYGKLGNYQVFYNPNNFQVSLINESNLKSLTFSNNIILNSGNTSN